LAQKKAPAKAGAFFASVDFGSNCLLDPRSSETTRQCPVISRVQTM